MRILALFAPSFLLAVPLLAQDPKSDPKPSNDSIAAELLKDKEAYAASVEKAKQEVLKAFDRYFENVKNNKA